MRRHTAHGVLCTLAAVGAAAAIHLGPGLAQGAAPSATGSFTLVDFAFNADGGGRNVTISAGGTVTFGYPSGASAHNAAFRTLQPTGCLQTAGTPSGPVPPLPRQPAEPGWSGTCTFATPGVYEFFCERHASMTGSVTVQGAEAAPPPPPPPPPPAADTTAPAGSAVRLSSTQRGSTVRGSLLVARAGSSVDVQALARRASVSNSKRTGSVRVGRFTRSSVGAGRVRFAVRLNVPARRALRRSGRLALSVRLRVTPPSGTAFTATRSVTLRSTASS